MRLKEKLVIDFKQFFKFGKFDFIKLGKTKEWVIHNFPDPDGYLDHSSVFKDDIWRYGNIEFHFHQEELFLIYSDYVDTLAGGDSLELEKWFLSKPTQFDLLCVMRFLNEERVDFAKKTSTAIPSSVVLELTSGVDLGFALEEEEEEDYLAYCNRSKSEDQSKFRLISFSLMRK